MTSLQKLLKSIDIRETLNEKELTISGISYHSQKVSAGHLFVCVTGYQTDGHRYLASAVNNGAVAAIVEHFQEGITIPQFQVKDSRIALAQLGAAYYDNPSDKMTLIGITASNGKTSTSYMANAILENHGLKTGLIGTVVVKIDDTSIPSELTTPESLDLQAYLHQMSERQVSHVTMEVSSAALDTHRVERVHYDIVTFNNLSREHIDAHGTFENYFEVKSRLIRHASENSVAVLNLDDPYSASLVNETNAQVVTYGMKSKDGHIYCKDLDLSSGRAKFTLEILRSFQAGGVEFTPSEFNLELAVPGLHSVYNSIAAIIIGLLCGVPSATIQNTLKTFTGVERRFQFIYEEPFVVIDDHFANPGNISVTLETLRHMDFAKLHLVYAIRGSRGQIINRENAEAIVEWMNRLEMTSIIATRSISHVTDKDRVTDGEVQVFLEVMAEANIEVKLFDELPDAITQAITEVAPRDVILLAGCQGMDSGAEIALQQLPSHESHSQQN